MSSNSEQTVDEVSSDQSGGDIERERKSRNRTGFRA
jgi:hypothetical protein